MPPAAGPGEVVDREAARVLLLDGAGRLLLFRGRDPAHPDDGTWWFTPGGGADPGESTEQTARRELWEETGLRPADFVGPVAERTTEFDFDGVRYRQHEHYFVVRLAGTDVEVAPAAHTELETRAVLGWRWWSSSDLLSTDEVVHPEWLASWLREDLSGPATGPDPAP